MSNFTTLKFRQCTDTFKANLWFVYHSLENGEELLVKECQSRDEAVQLVHDMLKEEIEATISSIDPSQTVSPEFLQQCIDEKFSLFVAVETFYSKHSFDVTTLKPLQGDGDDFYTEVRKLQRPYIAIMDDTHQALRDGKATYYQTLGGKVVSFGRGTVAGGNTQFALMPLCHEEAQKILASQ